MPQNQEMTVNEAERIIRETYDFGETFDAAIQFLKDNDPNNVALEPIKDKDIEEVRKARASAYLLKAVVEDEFGEQYEAAKALLKGEPNVQAVTAEAEEIFDKANHLDMEDEEAVLRNTSKIEGMLSDITYDRVKEDEEFADMSSVMDNVDIHDVNEDGSVADKVEDEKAIDYWQLAIEAAKQQAMMLRAGDKDFFMKKDEVKKTTLVQDVKNFFMINLAQGVAADAMQDGEKLPENPADYDKYVESRGKKAEAVINDLFSGGQKVVLTTRSILSNAVETTKKLGSYAARWAQKGFTRVADVFKKSKIKFDKFAHKVGGAAYEAQKQVVEYAKNNKHRLYADTAATAIVAGTVALGGATLGLAAIAAYAGYAAGGSWAWPVMEKKTKSLREAKKAGADTKEWDGIAGFKKAYAEIKSNKDEYRKYKNRAYAGTAVGVLGAGVAVGAGAASNFVLEKAGVLAVKAGTTVLRSFGSVTSQIMNFRDTKKDFKEDPSAENRAKLQQAKTGLWLGASMALLGSWLGLKNMEHATEKVQEAGTGLINKVMGWFSGHGHNATEVPADSLAADTVAVDTAAVASHAVDVDATGTDVSVVDVAEPVEISVPTEYDASMGISERHWNEMQRKLAGIYEAHSEIFGKTNVDSASAWENVYANIENARAANPELFGDNTNEQVLYKYMKLIENTERATAGPDGYLVTKLDADGLPTYGNKNMTETMRALNSIIICGDKVEIAPEKIGTVMGYIDESNGAYVGPHAGLGQTHNVYVGGRLGCDDEYQNAWKKGAAKVAKRIQKEVHIDDVVEDKPVGKPDVVVDDVVNNTAPAAAPEKEIDEVVVNEGVAQRKLRIMEGATDEDLNVNSPKAIKYSRQIGEVTVAGSGAEQATSHLDIYESATDGNPDVNARKVVERSKKIASVVVNSGKDPR